MLSKSISQFHESNNHMGKKLFDVMDKDTIFSPTSIAYVFALLHLASVENTHAQLCDIFGHMNSQQDLTKLQNQLNSEAGIKMANCIIINKSLSVNEQYIVMIQKLAAVLYRDFTKSGDVANEANTFIANGTNNLIKDIVKPAMITPDTVMLLINTLYFKTVWEHAFEKAFTEEKLFNNERMIPMMYQRHSLPYYEDDRVQMIEMAYKGNGYSMIFVLAKDGIDMKKCSEYLFGNVEFEKCDVDCSVPKFTQRKNCSLVPLFQQVGVTDIFSSAARLDNIGKGTFVSDAIHEAVVIVDEEGTEAVAVTVAVCMWTTCCRPKYIKFCLDRPFLYCIKNRSNGMVLFAGDFQ